MIETDLAKPIPCIDPPDAQNIKIIPIDDPLICISEKQQDSIICQPKYYERGIPGAIKQLYVRKTVFDMLLIAARLLPPGYKLLVFDAWRPIAVQKALYDDYHSRLLRMYKDTKSNAEIEKMASLFVSYPSACPDRPFVHSTGGAVDLTIVTPEGTALDMGTDFDDFSAAAHTVYFENSPSTEIRNNRRLLYNAMRLAGFTNYPSEWWHYDYGNLFWAAANNQKAIYSGIYAIPKNP